MEQEARDALYTAKSYMEKDYPSKRSLYTHLEYDCFSNDAIEYAINFFDEKMWLANVMKIALEYHNGLRISGTMLFNQLIGEGFTEAEVSYAVEKF